jgi:hypothetical protein
MHFAGKASINRNINPLVSLRVHLDFNRRVSMSQGNDLKKAEATRERGPYPRTRTVLKFSTTRPPSRGRPKFVCGRKRENIMS